jgi:putative hydrolase of the HAD superfamily
LFTKGSHEEQRSKLERSGLRCWFHHCEIVKEKDRQAYEQLLRLREFDSRRTWMIGNSPKSDINPALAAGLRAVFVPHERTWGLEHEEIVASDRLYIVKSFADLTQIFVVD